MKFPYGIADFQPLITEQYFYVDRTGHLPFIEDAGKQLLFLRPRRFGKSLLLSMLENYYDLAKADQFEQLFGRLAIGRNPTPKHNQYFIMKWDFSTIGAQGDVSEIRQALHNYINSRIEDFAAGYQPWLQPLCDFIEQRYFKVFDNRDYLHANELSVKTAFLTLLYNDQLYTADSETTLGRRYADLTMIVRPDARGSQLFDLLLEFKFVKLGDAGLSGEQARRMSRAELAALPPVQQKLAEARKQAADYLGELRARYSPELQPRVYAVVALGFERLVWEEIE